MIATLQDKEGQHGICSHCGGTAPPDAFVCDLCGSALQLQETTEALNAAMLKIAQMDEREKDLMVLLKMLMTAYREVPIPASSVDPWPMVDKIIGEE